MAEYAFVVSAEGGTTQYLTKPVRVDDNISSKVTPYLTEAYRFHFIETAESSKETLEERYPKLEVEIKEIKLEIVS